MEGNMYSEWRKGLKAAVPVIVGYVPIGLAFGILASQQGLTVGTVFLMSLIVYAGSSQFIAAAMMATGADAVSVISTTFLVNLRHLLMSASLSQHMKKFSTKLQSIISFGITDETFAVSGSYVQNNIATEGYFLGLHLASHGSWILSTVLGGIFVSRLTDTTKWGIDFALSAMFIGLLIMQLKDKKGLLVSLCAGVLSLILRINLNDNYNVIIAAVVAATIGVVTERWSK
ncbi:MAG: AzlC family ABC transporter permease [Clostridiaceae bacterium]|nr:AzlC family ABC transporter permease [Clostridiaceae bacterium]